MGKIDYKQIPWDISDVKFGSESGEVVQPTLAAHLKVIGIQAIDDDKVYSLADLPPISLTLQSDPVRYVMYMPQPPAEPVARFILASKTDVDRFLNHEPVKVMWQSLEGGEWVDSGIITLVFGKYTAAESDQ